MSELIVPSHAVIIPYRKNCRAFETLWQKKGESYKWGPYWSLFGGKIEDGESPEVALDREIKEELGDKIRVENIFLVGDQKYHHKAVDGSGDEREGAVRAYAGEFIGELSDISLREGAGWAFFTREDIDGRRFEAFECNRESVLRFYSLKTITK